MYEVEPLPRPLDYIKVAKCHLEIISAPSLEHIRATSGGLFPDLSSKSSAAAIGPAKAATSAPRWWGDMGGAALPSVLEGCIACPLNPLSQ